MQSSSKLCLLTQRRSVQSLCVAICPGNVNLKAYRTGNGVSRNVQHHKGNVPARLVRMRALRLVALVLAGVGGIRHESKFFEAVNSQQVLRFRPGDFGFDDCLQSPGQSPRSPSADILITVHQSKSTTSDRLRARYTLSARRRHVQPNASQKTVLNGWEFTPASTDYLPYLGAVADFNGNPAGTLDWRRNARAYVSFWSQVSYLGKYSPFAHALLGVANGITRFGLCLGGGCMASSGSLVVWRLSEQEST